MSDTCFGRTQHQTRERIQESQVVIQCRWPSTMQQRRVSHVPSGSRTLLGTENLKENRNEAALAHPRPVDIDDEQDGRHVAMECLWVCMDRCVTQWHECRCVWFCRNDSRVCMHRCVTQWRASCVVVVCAVGGMIDECAWIDLTLRSVLCVCCGGMIDEREKMGDRKCTVVRRPLSMNGAQVSKQDAANSTHAA
jgi:hypothetical protein